MSFNDMKYYLWRLYCVLLKPCAIEINLVSHCNLNCAGCSHYSPIAPKSFIGIDEFKTTVMQLKRISKAYKKLRLLGGEPLLHPDILEIMKIAGEELRHTTIELYTNGIILSAEKNHTFFESFAEICRDYGIRVYLTLYPVNVDYDKLIEELGKRSVKVALMGDRRSGGTFSLLRLNAARKGKRYNYYICSEAGCMQLVDDKIYPCSESAYSEFVNEKYGLSFVHEKGDYIRIADVRHFYSLWWFRMKSKPFCKYCVFPRPAIPWGHSKHSSDEWVVKE